MYKIDINEESGFVQDSDVVSSHVNTTAWSSYVDQRMGISTPEDRDGGLAEVAPEKDDFRAGFELVRRRLDTAEDLFDAHKISSVVYVLSSTLMLFVGATTGFTKVPPVLELPTWLFLISSWIQGITSIDMSIKYRSNDPVVKNGFIGMAVNVIGLAWANMYVSPFAPDAFNNFYFGNGILALTQIPILYGLVKQLLNLRECIDHRKIRKKEKGGDLGAVGDFLSYGLGTLAGCGVGLISIPMLVDPTHDRLWLMEVNEMGLLPSGDLFVPYNYYTNVITSSAVAYGALAITLRDKKLISKDMEQTIIGVPTVLFALALMRIFEII